jgi:hypothetical protein
MRGSGHPNAKIQSRAEQSRLDLDARPPDSLAIDVRNNTANLAFERRGSGFPRGRGAAADIGAFEAQAETPTVSSLTASTAPPQW